MSTPREPEAIVVTPAATPAVGAAAFAVSERAARRIAEIIASQPGPNQPDAAAPLDTETEIGQAGPTSRALRVAVLAGGCSGFQYRFELDHRRQPDDHEIQAGAARVLVDPTSLDLLAGAELDYSEALIGAHFTVRNPNATSSCGCGTSFSID